MPGFCCQRDVEFAGEGGAIAVGCVFGILRRPVARVVVDRQPDWLVEQRVAGDALDLLCQLPVAFRRQRGDGGQAAPLQNRLHIGGSRTRGDGQGIGWQLVLPPEGGPVRFAVEFEVAHARADELLHLFQFCGGEGTGVGCVAHDLDDRHDLRRQECLRQLQRVAMAGDLDPLDAQFDQLRQPERFHHVGRRRAGTGAPVDTNACIVFRAGIGVQLHEVGLYSGY